MSKLSPVDCSCVDSDLSFNTFCQSQYNKQAYQCSLKVKKISNDQELIQSDPTSCPKTKSLFLTVFGISSRRNPNHQLIVTKSVMTFFFEICIPEKSRVMFYHSDCGLVAI